VATPSDYTKFRSETIKAVGKLPGWQTERRAKGVVLITNPLGQSVPLHATPSDTDTVVIVRGRLRRLGLDDALRKQMAAAKLGADAQRDADAARAERELEKAQDEANARALRWAAGASIVPVATLLTPSSVRRVYTQVEITPAIAEKLLAANGSNHPARPTLINAYADTMRAGHWSDDAQGMRINSNGALQDGQHRLAAVVQSGTTIYADITVGCAPESFAVLDSGRKRTAADVLSMMAGERVATDVAGAYRTLWLYHEYKSAQDWVRIRQTNDELVAFQREHPEYQELVMLGLRTYRSPGKAAGIITSALGAFAAYGWARLGTSYQPFNTFLDDVAVGANLDRRSVAFLTRRYFGNTSNNGKQHRNPRVHFGVLARSWLYVATDRKVDVIHWKSTDIVQTFYVPAPDLP
jgi:hypothetical protein